MPDKIMSPRQIFMSLYYIQDPTEADVEKCITELQRWMESEMESGKEIMAHYNISEQVWAIYINHLKEEAGK